MKTHQESAKTSTKTQNAAPFFAPIIQRKLTVNQPGDHFEQQADAVADQVMRMKTSDAPIVQRMPFSTISGGLQRKCAGCENEEKLQRKETSGGDASGKAAPASVQNTLSSGGGSAMDATTAQFMESRFGQDFSGVRIKTDENAAQSAADIQARAYTSGNQIVFGKGEYRPASDDGRRLLAHELVHVGQQSGSESLQRQPVQRQTVCPTTCPPGTAPPYVPVTNASYNCYSYAMNNPRTLFRQPGSTGGGTPEFNAAMKGNNQGFSSLNVSEKRLYRFYFSPRGIIKNAEHDLGSRAFSNCNGCCPLSKRKIIAVTTDAVGPSGSLTNASGQMIWDHHWYRKDADGGWSHKHGGWNSQRHDDTSTTAQLCNPCSSNRAIGSLDYKHIVGAWCI